MSSYLNRFLWRFRTPLAFIVGIASVGFVYSGPIKYIFIDSQKEEFYNGESNL